MMSKEFECLETPGVMKATLEMAYNEGIHPDDIEKWLDKVLTNFSQNSWIIESPKQKTYGYNGEYMMIQKV
jgi:hypothetical protein